MSRRAENTSGFTRSHKTLIAVSRFFAGLGWMIAFAGLAMAGFAWPAAGMAFAEISESGMATDMTTVAGAAAPFLSGLMMLLSGLLAVAYGQVMRVISSIEANTQAAFLILDRRLPNPHPDVDDYRSLNETGLHTIPM